MGILAPAGEHVGATGCVDATANGALKIWRIGGCELATLYLIMGVAGATVLILQFIFTLLGFDHHGIDSDVSGDSDMSIDAAHDGTGGDHTADHPVDEASMFFKMLSVRAVVAAVTFFGWSGLAALEGGLAVWLSVAIACGAGLVAMYIVAWMLRALSSLHDEGNVHIERSIGTRGVVYLTIPPNRQGIGKVQVNVQERTMEYDAVSADGGLPTGSPVIVVNIVDDNTVEVRPAPRVEELE